MSKEFNKFVSIQNWLNESKKEDEILYGCVMAEPNKIKDWEENHLSGIDEEDIYDTDEEDYGLEEQPHITILYGIHEDEIDPSVIVDMIEQRMEPFSIQISEIDIFENDDYDVVKYNVPVTDTLKEYREMFENSFENTQTFDGYHPHMTIAYVKSGTGKKYKKKLDKPFKVRFSKGVYSYHKQDEKGNKIDEKIRKIVNLVPEKNKMNDDIVKSKHVENGNI